MNQAVLHFSLAGIGTLRIRRLASDQLSAESAGLSPKRIVKGSQFNAEFVVQAPAKMPVPSGVSAPDPTAFYTGKGMFITRNTKVKVESA